MVTKANNFTAATAALLFVAFSGILFNLMPPAFADDDARREYERLMKREEELVGYEPQSMFTPKGGSHGWDKFEQDELNRASGIDVPPLPPRDVGDLEGWGNYIKEAELKRIRDRKNEIRRGAFGGGDDGPAPAPRPSPKPKPEYGPFREGDPRNKPAPKKSPPPHGVGPTGPEPLPAEDPNQFQAKAPLRFDGLLGKWGMNRGAGSQVLGHAFKQDTSASSSSSLKADCNYG